MKSEHAARTQIPNRGGYPVHINLGNGWFCGGPGNERDRKRFVSLSEIDRVWCSDRAEQLYNGSRTVARCWDTALNECFDPDIVGNCV